MSAPTLQVAGVPVICQQTSPPQPWWERCTEDFARSVGQREYPCHFGRVALAKGELFATFFDGPGPELAWALGEFLERSQRDPGRRLVLAAFRRPEDEPRDHAWYEQEFWRVLQELHDRDDRPWPADIPSHPEHASWEFSFAGVPMFAFSAAPTYQRRQSRNLGAGLVLLFQPRTVFADVTGGTPGGVRARRTIRRRLAEWDTVGPHADLGDYGDPSNYEWRQYFIADDDSRLRETCPLHVRGDTAARPEGD
ncbi:YqcI/YcgG family protein [Actinophytocola sp.]|jgi:FPC/CPF motif-containing protein YcgG|uniref:YqcI/YcgG family protein n=1 Tax=Actinophytocola sp. TaxID=1872138 RepID=UPI002ED8287F